MVPDFDAVRLAGEPESEALRVREKDGITLDHQTWAEILVAGRNVAAILQSSIPSPACSGINLNIAT